ncbi:hypothetical protein GEV33_003532 [Tenebrio molitor]|uniref:Uncharacterized protein n=1 Tax=Tenebrio molitor TaxID=7067 RepID=A0A8J6HR96_TENMO|nr:hypothetical protein GEV33_003532 [Tenebrio molitor]
MAGRAATPQGRKLGNINNMPNRRYLPRNTQERHATIINDADEPFITLAGEVRAAQQREPHTQELISLRRKLDHDPPVVDWHYASVPQPRYTSRTSFDSELSLSIMTFHWRVTPGRKKHIEAYQKVTTGPQVKGILGLM